MRVQRKNVENFHEQNADFCTAVESIVKDIFQTETLGPIPYVHSRILQTNPQDKRLEPRFSIDTLGGHERSVLDSMVAGENRVTVLRGEMGSGKTATAQIVLKTLGQPRSILCDQCSQRAVGDECQPLVFRINFATGYHLKSEEVLDKFQYEIYDALRSSVRPLMQRPGWIDAFLPFTKAESHRQMFSTFDVFQQFLEDRPDVWAGLDAVHRANKLFDFIEEKTGRVDRRIEALLKILRFISERYRPDQSCIGILLDNLDSVPKDAQFDLLAYVLSLKRFANINILMPLRKSTFERLPNAAGTSFKVLDHVGPDPRDIVYRRIRHAQQNFEVLIKEAGLSDEHKDALQQRLRYVGELFHRKSPVLDKVFSLSGGEYSPRTLPL